MQPTPTLPFPSGRLLLAKARLYARLVTLEHSVFALPFAYAGLLLAARDAGQRGPDLWTTAWLTLAMVCARSFAMGYNRLADRDIDRLNPRTRTRPLPAGKVTVGEVRLLLTGTAALFLLACAALNKLALVLGVPALAFAALYSQTKRFTPLCHFVLGAVLGLAPLAGMVAQGGDPSRGLVIAGACLFLGVTFWVAGFDLLYASQDTDFDRAHGLYSLPARLGVGTALAVSAFCHAVTVLFFGLAGLAAALSWPYHLVLLLIAALLALEHRLISEDNLERIDLAFFTLNGVVAIVFFLGLAAGTIV